MTGESHLQLAREVAGRYADLEMVEAVTLGGSTASGLAEPESDIDLYVYSSEPVPVSDRGEIATSSASRVEVDNQFWEPGDEWIDASTGIHVDVMFRSCEWIEDQLNRVLIRHEASIGYSTCFWHNVRHSRPLFDRDSWFAGLQSFANQPYPDELLGAIVNKNYPVLRTTLSSYRHQVHRALARGDMVSVNHRLAAFLASYFDILFALNRLTHPGEKHLVQYVDETCELKPHNLAGLIETMLAHGSHGDPEAIQPLDQLVDSLDELLHHNRSH